MNPNTLQYHAVSAHMQERLAVAEARRLASGRRRRRWALPRLRWTTTAATSGASSATPATAAGAPNSR